ncbi:MAG: GIY-YIG nuclease family protein [Myxococcaceae bacterium]
MSKSGDQTWVVYVLECSDGSLYTGITNRLVYRLAAHNSGKGARYTRSRRPVTLRHQEKAKDKGAALRREAALKKLSRRQKLSWLAAAARLKTRRRRRSPPPRPARRR